MFSRRRCSIQTRWQKSCITIRIVKSVLPLDAQSEYGSTVEEVLAASRVAHASRKPESHCCHGGAVPMADYIRSYFAPVGLRCRRADVACRRWVGTGEWPAAWVTAARCSDGPGRATWASRRSMSMGSTRGQDAAGSAMAVPWQHVHGCWCHLQAHDRYAVNCFQRLC